MAAIHHISSDFDPISAATLPPVQAQVVAALAEGQTITSAALEAKVHRTTIHHWMRTEPDFKAAVETAQREYVAELRDEMRALSARALATLRSLLDDPSAPPSVRLRAALAVLQRPKSPDQGWSLPEPIESQPPQPDAPPEPVIPEPPRPEPSRCAPCPCGSGLKYKRCCAGRSLATSNIQHPTSNIRLSPT